MAVQGNVGGGFLGEYVQTGGANLAGLCSIVVEPIELKNLFYILRYGIEIPFRICRRKEKL